MDRFHCCQATCQLLVPFRVPSHILKISPIYLFFFNSFPIIIFTRFTMWKAIGWLLVFLFPLVMVYLTGGPSTEPLLDDDEYQRRQRLAAAKNNSADKSVAKSSKNKKKNKKNKTATAPVVAERAVVVEEEKKPNKKEEAKQKNNNTKKTASKKEAKKAVAAAAEKTPKQQQQQQQPEAAAPKKEPVKAETPKKEPVAAPVEAPKEEKVDKVKEIDEHMDPTAQYARVMRIRQEESDDDWEAVPYEEGWSQVKTRRPYNPSKNNIDVNAEINNVSMISNSPLDKKQRENLSRSQKKKAAKAEADKLQAERLKKHQKELEKIKIQEFYSSGKGKNTPWGKNGQRSSSKVPQSVASINEFGQLIWE